MCRRARRCVRRERRGGPARRAQRRARARRRREFVAFLDSDSVPPPDWIERLGGHFDDPRVAAVAPRIRRFGRRAVAARPRARAATCAYVPSAALIVRRARCSRAFDPALRYGEDVDLIWRLLDGGLAGPLRARRGRRARGARPAQAALPVRDVGGAARARHPDKIRHVSLRPWPVATLLLARAAATRRAGVPRAHGAARAELHAKGVPARLAPALDREGARRRPSRSSPGLPRRTAPGWHSATFVSKIRGLPTI